jgi:alpha-L-rhamnosidase
VLIQCTASYFDDTLVRFRPRRVESEIQEIQPPAQTHFSQHANILGVWLDVIPTEKQRAVLTNVLSTSDPGLSARASVPQMTAATYYFRFYLARAIDHAGMGDRYLQLLGPWCDITAVHIS